MAKRKRLLPLMIIPCLLLSACASFRKNVDVDQTGITEFYKALESAQMQVGVSADFPERISKYRVAYSYKKNDTSTLTILEPKSVADIQIAIAQGQTELQFGGARLETGTLDESGLTPLSALPCLMKAWSQGDVSEAEAVSRDGTKALLLIYRNQVEEQEIEYRTWFDRSTYHPIYAEVLTDGKCVIRCEFETVAKN